MKIPGNHCKTDAFLLAVCMLAPRLWPDGIYTDKEGNISYSPMSRGSIPTAATPLTKSPIPLWVPVRWTAFSLATCRIADRATPGPWQKWETMCTSGPATSTYYISTTM